MLSADDPTPPTTPEPANAQPVAAATPASKKDGRSKTSAANGKAGGCPIGTLSPSKRTYPPDTLLDATAAAILAGKRSPLTLPKVRPPTEDDRAALGRMIQGSADEFLSELAARLRYGARKIADTIIARIEQDPDGQKLSDLNMGLAIMIDKHSALSGRSSSTGNVSVQINNFGTMSRDQLLGLAKGKHDIINVTDTPPSDAHDDRPAA